MLDQEQIDNWDGVSDNMRAAIEYHRRHRKKLPTDRYCDGADGAKAVGEGIGELVQAIVSLYAENVSLKRAEQARGADSMTAYQDPMR